MVVADAHTPMSAETQAAYLERLELDAEPPSVGALHRLHRRHVERIPYETLWIHGGEPWDIDVARATTRIAKLGRGGYCFHLNGAFSELLRSLGYAVTRHVGGVHGPDGPDAASMSNHLVLTVSDLPTAENPSGFWYVDAGLGDALHEPVPLIPGEFVQGPFRFVLDETPGEIGDWHLTHDPAGGFPGMSWRTTPATMNEFADQHEWLSKSPESGFVRIVTVQRRDATGVDVLRGLMLLRVGEGSAPTEPLTDRGEWFSALRDRFDIDIDTIDPDVRDALWERTRAKHEKWEAAGRPV